jgi:ABC transport system ATP-binding/permease protein
MRTEAIASPLTVWVGPSKHVFSPGRDVTVGAGSCDIRLDAPSAAPQPPRPDMVLRFAANQWVAVSSSPHGIFVDGHRMATVNIRDGQAITVGHPRGPRLIFQLGLAPDGPPAGPPAQPAAPAYPPASPPRAPVPPPPNPNQQVPTARTTQRMPVVSLQPATVEQPVPPVASGSVVAAPPAPPAPPSPPVAQPPAPPVAEPPGPPAPVPTAPVGEQPKGRGLMEWMGAATKKFRAARPETSTTHRLPLYPGARTDGVNAYRLGLNVHGYQALTDVSFTARPGTLTLVVGPPAGRNSALLDLLAGTRTLTSGQVTVDGHDVHTEPESLRARVGVVARDDHLHSSLTVERVLSYAAELRLPPNATADYRRRVVDQVLEELTLTPHRATRIGKLSPELRRCASLAVELITRPTLLVVDDPGAGLDVLQENYVMAALRRQADIGCVVVVAMPPESSLRHVNTCDQVLLLTAAGTTAYLGSPLGVETAMGTANWADVLGSVSADPDRAHRAFLARRDAAPPTAPEVAAPGPPPAGLPFKRQLRLVARRQLRLLIAERLWLLFLVALPCALAGLILLVPGDSGLGKPAPSSHDLHEAVEILAALNIAAVIIGTTLTIRELVRERRVFRDEQTVGLSAPAYLCAKILVFSAVAAVLTAVTVGIVVVVKGGPVHGAVLLGNATVELYVSVAATAVVSAVVGLAMSSLGKSLGEVLPLLVPAILASALFAGGLITLVGTWVYDQFSWFVPAQWGFAASASTVDLRRVDPLGANALVWTHYVGWWVFDMTMLILLGAAWAGLALYRLRAPTRVGGDQPLHRQQQKLSDLRG